MNKQSLRPGVLAVAAASALVWRCGAATPMQAPPTLDLPTTIRLALDQPGVRAAAQDVAAGDAGVDQADRPPNPELAILREGQDAGARKTTAQINQPIELGGKRRARVALARGIAEAARREEDAVRRQARADAMLAYYETLVAQQRQALALGLGALAHRSVEVAARRVAAGKVSPIDETRARLAEADAIAEQRQATAQLALARAKLGARIGRPADAVVLPEPPPDLPDVAPLSTLLAQGLDAAPVLRARGRLAVQDAQAGVERAARIPDVTVSIGTQRDDQVGRRQAVFGVAVPLPLFNRNEGNLRAALHRADKAREELAAAQTATAAALADAHIRFEAARADAALLRRDVIPGARSAYDLTLKGFEYGKFALLDVLDAQRTWFQAQSRLWTAMLDAYRAYADIEGLAGSTPPDNRD